MNIISRGCRGGFGERASKTAPEIPCRSLPNEEFANSTTYNDSSINMSLLVLADVRMSVQRPSSRRPLLFDHCPRTSQQSPTTSARASWALRHDQPRAVWGLLIFTATSLVVICLHSRGMARPDQSPNRRTASESLPRLFVLVLLINVILSWMMASPLSHTRAKIAHYIQRVTGSAKVTNEMHRRPSLMSLLYQYELTRH